MAASFSVETSAELTIGTRTITLYGKVPTLGTSDTMVLSFHAGSLDEAVDFGSAADAFNALVGLAGAAGTELWTEVGNVKTALSTLPVPQPPPANVLAVLVKIKQVVDSLGWDNAAARFTYHGTAVARVYMTDLVMKASVQDGAPRAFEVALMFKFEDVRFLNIALQAAGIRVKVEISP